MKIFAIGDPHGKLPKNLDKISKIDMIICVGDIPPVPSDFRKGKITSFPKSFLKKADKLFSEIIERLCSYKKPMLTLRENMYLTGSRNKLTKRIFSSYDNLYYKKTGKLKINEKNFVFFDMGFEPYMYHKADSWMKGQFKSNKQRESKLYRLLNELNEAIVISHAPSFGYLDKTKKFGNRGFENSSESDKKISAKISFMRAHS